MNPLALFATLTLASSAIADEEPFEPISLVDARQADDFYLWGHSAAVARCSARIALDASL